jgi:hypothetical protein
VVQLNPVRVEAAARYLLEGRVGSAREAWQQVTDRLQADPDGVLARTLNTPLTLSLARSAYNRDNPTQLLAPELSTEQVLRGHLLDQVLVTAYPDPSPRGHAVQWLGWLAHSMNTERAGPTRDLRWWDMPSWILRWQMQLIGALVGGLLFGLVLIQTDRLIKEFMFGLNFGHAIEPGVVLTIALVLGLSSGLVIGHAGGTSRSIVLRQRGPQNLRPWSSNLVGALVFGLGGGLGAGLLSGLKLGLFFAGVAGLLFWFIGPGSGDIPRLMVRRRPTRQDFRQMPGRLGSGILIGVLVGIVIGWAGWLVGGARVAFPVGLLTWLMAGVSIGLASWLLSDVWSLPIATTADITPYSCYRKDLQSGLISGLVFGSRRSLWGSCWGSCSYCTGWWRASISTEMS